MHPDPMVQEWVQNNPKTFFLTMLEEADSIADPAKQQHLYQLLNDYVRPHLHSRPASNAPLSFLEHKILGRDCNIR